MKVPQTIRCKVIKTSKYSRWDDQGAMKAITFSAVPGRYFSFGDEAKENAYDQVHLSISCCDSVPAFFDGLEVGQVVDLEIKPALETKGP